ncbi:MAG TPA: hypothetical protein ENK57_21905 [Polyangiaceae bacterium]|nr:hypothetical protein [Polyangiaceae bacterium]
MKPRYPALRAAHRKRYPRDGCAWTLEDQRVLIEHWPKKSIRELAAILGRTEEAVRRRVRTIESSHLNVRAYARKVGFSRVAVMNAIRELGFVVRPRRVTYERRGRRQARKWGALTPYQQEKLTAYLLADRPLRPPPTEWGKAGRPPACVDCETTTRPHYAHDRCRRCYENRRNRQAAARSSDE